MINIGVFDSGIGGLWILKFLKEEIPDNNYIYFADQAHVPYGNKSLDEVRSFSIEITKFLIKNNCKIIVIACNTASAAALKFLRIQFPEIIFVGMEPAIKPAVEKTITKKVGVLATMATFQGELYNSVVERFAHDVTIIKDPCFGLVEQIEKGDIESKETKNILEEILIPMVKSEIDTIVLGCTHYPFIIPLIKKIIGNKINIIDPTSAIVERVKSIIQDNNLSNKNETKHLAFTKIFTSGNVDNINYVLPILFKEKINVASINLIKEANK